MENRCISKSGRLIFDIIEICGNENIPDYLVTMDLEKACDSLDHNFFMRFEKFLALVIVLLTGLKYC